MSAARFRFGLLADARRRSREDWIALAKRAEELGYSTFQVADHFHLPAAPLLTLLLAAEATQRIRLGTLVLNNDFRHPAILAKEVSTLAGLSGDRFELGLGAGWMAGEYERAGLRFEPGRVRVARLEESINVIESLLKPRPPLLIGAAGPRLLRIAALRADIVGLNVSSAGVDDRLDPGQLQPATVARKAELVRRAAGSRRKAIELHLNVQFAAVGPDAGARVTGRAARWGVTPADLAESPYALLGTVPEIVARLEERRRLLGVSYFTVPSGQLEEFAPVVATLGHDHD